MLYRGQEDIELRALRTCGVLLQDGSSKPLEKAWDPFGSLQAVEKKEKIQKMENIHESHMKIVMEFEKIENT